MMIGPGDQTGRPYIIIWVSHTRQFCNSLLKCKQTQTNTLFSPSQSTILRPFPLHIPVTILEKYVVKHICE